MLLVRKLNFSIDPAQIDKHNLKHNVIHKKEEETPWPKKS